MQRQRFKADRHEERPHARYLRDSVIEASCGLKARDRKSTRGAKWRRDRGTPIQFDVSCKWILKPCFRRGRRTLIPFASAGRIHGDLQIRDNWSPYCGLKISTLGCIFRGSAGQLCLTPRPLSICEISFSRHSTRTFPQDLWNIFGTARMMGNEQRRAA